jgi:hypothetical protein
MTRRCCAPTQTYCFAAIGNWGTGTFAQRAVAQAMSEYFHHCNRYTRRQVVISLGNSFYPAGITSPTADVVTDRFHNGECVRRRRLLPPHASQCRSLCAVYATQSDLYAIEWALVPG